MTYEVVMHPLVRKQLARLYRSSRPDYEYVKKRLLLLAYKPDMGQPLCDEFRGKWRIHIGPYVLVYMIDRPRKTLTILTFEHYTRVYDRFKAYA